MENPTEHLVVGLPLRAYLWLFLAVIVVPAVCEDPCDNGWFYVEYDGSARCYFISSDSSSRSFSEASSSCSSKGAHLASIATYSESQALITLFSSKQEDERFKRNDYWIGLRRSDKGQPWQWLDGTELKWENWNAERKEPQETETCARIVYEDNFEWRGIDCDREFGRICEKMPNTTFTTQSVSPTMPSAGSTVPSTTSPPVTASSSMSSTDKDKEPTESRTEDSSTERILTGVLITFVIIGIAVIVIIAVILLKPIPRDQPPSLVEEARRQPVQTQFNELKDIGGTRTGETNIGLDVVEDDTRVDADASPRGQVIYENIAAASKQRD